MAMPPHGARLVFFGSGAFGEPTLRGLRELHDIPLIVTQPDRRAGRGRKHTTTPIGLMAERFGIPALKPEDVNDPAVVEAIHHVRADLFVVIAFGQKLGPTLLRDHFAVNLHASLLPRYRGAAPINHAMIHGDERTGVSVITLAERMDAGAVLASRATAIRAHETAGELHDRLAELGVEPVLEVIDQFRRDALAPMPQDDAQATRAPKLKKSDGVLDFTQTARALRCRIHGLTPWPGCSVTINGALLKLLRVEEVEDEKNDAAPPAHPAADTGSRVPGTVGEDGTIACGTGRLRLLSVQPAGGRSMTFDAFRNGRAIPPGAVVMNPDHCSTPADAEMMP